jgi:para-aminobenzoate synthetase component 2
MSARILIIDNYDSFTYNLVQYLGKLGANLIVRRNDAIDGVGARDLDPDAIIISPGPCTPAEAGISVTLLREFAGKLPMLGVCLGHQCIGVAFGGRVARAGRIMHGKTSPVIHDGKALFRGLSNPFEAMRYHSLLVETSPLPACLEVSARTAEGEIMGLRHREYPIEGVQFHPESIGTPEGKALLQNFLDGLNA